MRGINKIALYIRDSKKIIEKEKIDIEKKKVVKKEKPKPILKSRGGIKT